MRGSVHCQRATGGGSSGRGATPLHRARTAHAQRVEPYAHDVPSEHGAPTGSSARVAAHAARLGDALVNRAEVPASGRATGAGAVAMGAADAGGVALEDDAMSVDASSDPSSEDQAGTTNAAGSTGAAEEPPTSGAPTGVGDAVSVDPRSAPQAITQATAAMANAARTWAIPIDASSHRPARTGRSRLPPEEPVRRTCSRACRRCRSAWSRRSSGRTGPRT